FAHHIAHHHSARIERVQSESHTGRTRGRTRSRSWPEPLSGTSHPGAAILVAAADLPAIEQRTFDGFALCRFEIQVLRGRAQHSVERPVYGSVARPQWHHGAFLVHYLAQPFDNAALSCSCRPNQNNQTMGSAFAIDYLVAGVTQQLPDLLAAHQGTGANAEQAGSAFRDGRKHWIFAATTHPFSARSFRRF